MTMHFEHFRDMAIAAREHGLKELQTNFGVNGIGAFGPPLAFIEPTQPTRADL